MGQKYGTTPWGAWFIDVLDSYRMGARLERGKTYANTGRVLNVKFDGRTVTARVRGRSSPYYTVVIRFPKLEEADSVCSLAGEDPLLLARIATGELPEEFLKKLKKRGIALIPTRWSDMKRSCSCPDWGDPCKHMAAVYYILAREIDTNPHVIFKLRGIDLAERFGSSIVRTLRPPFNISYSGPDDHTANDGAPYTVPDFGSCLNFIQSLLPPSPAFASRDFSVALTSYYHRAMRDSLRDEAVNMAGAQPIDGWETEHRFSSARWAASARTKARASASGSAIPHNAHVTLSMSLAGEAEREFTLEEASRYFLGFSEEEGTDGYRFLFRFFRFARAVERATAYIPCPYVAGDDLEILWQPLFSVSAIHDAETQLARSEPGLFCVKAKRAQYLSGLSSVQLLACAYLTERVRAGHFSTQGGDDSFRSLQNAFFSGTAINVANPAFRSLPLAIDAWLSAFSLDYQAFRYRFTLKERGRAEKRGEFSLSAAILLDGEEVPLKDASAKTGDIEVLRAPTVLSLYLGELGTLMMKKNVVISGERLAGFLGETSGLLSLLGVEVVLPKSLHRELKPRLALHTETKKQAKALVSYLDLDSILDYEWRIAIGDTVLTTDEFALLVKDQTGLVAFRDGYVLLDPEETAKLLKQAAAKRRPGVLEAVRQRITGEASFSPAAARLVDSLLAERDFPVPAALRATLRPYQERGFRWICSLISGGFGCILADDMGLGKTVQAIAAALALRERGLLAGSPQAGGKRAGGILVLAPAALLANWERELARFAPCLSVRLFHGTGRKLDPKADVHLTTWQTAVRAADALNAHGFSLLIADEAHLMKNADTKISRTAKALSAPYKLALSGTPVENRLEDMRSLFDFIIPGYLGSESSFRTEFRVPIEVERNEGAASKLRSITAPFLLRRLKTDRSIISDLPDKVTITEFASLTREQAALYESLVQQGIAQSSATEGSKDRAALILALLTALKQTCDHPRVYDRKSPAEASRSGKCGLLVTLLTDILRNREKVLVFSQYVETLKLLDTVISKELGEQALLYHGGMTTASRNKAVDSFQNDDSWRIMLVSLKAGGLGLNLTAASRVIHFDLWYNPAVEQQATDRAFRIGQTRKVFVHRFVTKGTFEEKIDAMLSSRRELADMTVASGETWLARMSHEELANLFGKKTSGSQCISGGEG